MNALKICIMLLCYTICAGQEINPTAISLYQRCISELAEPGVDNRYLPEVIQRDIYSLQVERFAEYSRVYEELRAQGLQWDRAEHIDEFSPPTQGAIVYARKHFPHSEVSCATKCARAYVEMPWKAKFICELQGVFGGTGIMLGAVLPVWAVAKIGLITIGSVSLGSSLVGLYLHTCFRKQCLDVALPHYNAPRTLHMDLEISDDTRVQQMTLYVDEDLSAEEEALLED